MLLIKFELDWLVVTEKNMFKYTDGRPTSWLKDQRSSLTLGTLSISNKYNGFGFNSNWPSPNFTDLLVQ